LLPRIPLSWRACATRNLGLSRIRAGTTSFRRSHADRPARAQSPSLGGRRSLAMFVAECPTICRLGARRVVRLLVCALCAGSLSHLLSSCFSRLTCGEVVKPGPWHGSRSPSQDPLAPARRACRIDCRLDLHDRSSLWYAQYPNTVDTVAFSRSGGHDGSSERRLRGTARQIEQPLYQPVGVLASSALRLPGPSWRYTRNEKQKPPSPWPLPLGGGEEKERGASAVQQRSMGGHLLPHRWIPPAVVPLRAPSLCS